MAPIHAPNVAQATPAVPTYVMRENKGIGMLGSVIAMGSRGTRHSASRIGQRPAIAAILS
jgi:hypothetical protein